MAGRIIRQADLARVPWKNGAGTTAEVAAFPEGSSFEDFGWRISMADVGSDGPFSAFPGIDRTLILVAGDRLDLEVEGVPYRLDSEFPKLSFSGDDETIARLSSGPIRDLNIMTRRELFVHRTRIMRSGVTLLHDDTCAAFIIPIDAPMDVTADHDIHALQALDTLVLDLSQDLLQLTGPGRAVLVEIVAQVTQ